ncbi:sugar ABC transporter permease [Actinopolymorpha pittospori]|uniref:carbohydrate ABC transporter permease n=1 Tax=Actinopolymorpha pittospori TaxID=648752 RepID=UPI0031EBBA08
MPTSRAVRRRGRRQPYVLLSPALVVIGVLFLFPAIYNVVLAFQKLTPYDAPGDATWVGWSNFAALLHNPETGQSAFNTVFRLTAITVAIRLVIGMALALLLQSQVLHRWKLRGVARTMVLVPWMIPPVVAVASWRWLLDANTGVLNQVLVATGMIDRGVPFLANTGTVWWSVIAILVWRELPFVVIVLLAGLQSIPKDQYEAAALDSAGAWGSFRYVTLPHLRPVVTVVVLMTVIQTFNNFVYVWLATGGGPGTYTQVLATQLYSAAFIGNSLGQGAAIGLVMSAVMAVFALAYLRVSARREEAL